MGFFEHLGVQPADRAAATAAAGPQRAVGILGELQVMGAETRANERDQPGFRIVHGEVPVARGEREKLRRHIARSLFAEGRVVTGADSGREPYAPFLVEHRIVHVGPAVPDRFLSPIRRRRQWLPRCKGRVRIAH